MWRYKLLLFILFIPLAIYTLWQSLRAFELRYFLQRIAISYGSKSKKGGVWIHTASVGEVNAVMPLILKLTEEKPTLPITITSNTTTSAAVIKKQLPSNIRHFYFPLDYNWAIKRILNKINPKAVFIVETEFWPNLYTELHQRNIPLTIINGRVSEKTLHAKQWLKNIYSEILPLVTNVYARSETDQGRFVELGLESTKIDVLGNIKLSVQTEQQIEPINLNRAYVLAASTREDEEQIIVEAWLKSERKDLLLVIVPRHPNRLSEILSQLKQFKLNITIRSKKEPVTPQTDIYIADTIGELKQFIAGSEFVLMGGSFVNKGGHNILEVAQLGKSVIFGPVMSNFEDESELFLQHEAGIQCDNKQLASTFTRLVNNKKYRTSIEENAINLIKANDNIDKYYKILKELL
ncbi:MAG: 3-deoxy-D-manno-octulosonic acid transferase [Gammaproteobacteria bacterium]|nr:3-deoxy-D-manno-octulosonic acid transferase [Gammaproteobacteria bacterium]MDH5659489.1 3-deoxy-D-manno-octulosonic acid transferase [Gammaproteobacteria bacterium]